MMETFNFKNIQEIAIKQHNIKLEEDKKYTEMYIADRIEHIKKRITIEANLGSFKCEYCIDKSDYVDKTIIKEISSYFESLGFKVIIRDSNKLTIFWNDS